MEGEVTTFDDLSISIKQYNQVYHLVNAYEGGETPFFVVKAKTTGRVFLEVINMTGLKL